jgi:hypothetical protein
MFWNTLNIFHFYHQLAEVVQVQWFRKNFVHSAFDSSVDVLVFDVSSDGDDLGLAFDWDVHLIVEFSDFGSAFVAVHDWHVAVH